MEDFLNRFGDCSSGTCSFSDVRSGLIVGLLSIGTLIGALIGAPTADFFGRRNAMSLECLVFATGVVIQMTSFHAWYQFESRATSRATYCTSSDCLRDRNLSQNHGLTKGGLHSPRTVP